MTATPPPDPRRVVEELVYQRVRLDADLQAMTDLEQDLAFSFRRALREVDGTSDDLAAFVDRAVELALVRVAGELAAEAEDGDLADCPLCEGPLAGPAD